MELMHWCIVSNERKIGVPNMKFLLLCAFIAASSLAQAQPNKTFKSEHYTLRATTVVDGLKNPWAVAFLPDGRMLITERIGAMRLVEKGKLLAAEITGLPKVTEHGQGGLLDVVLHPKYAENGWIYWTYNAVEDGLHGTEVARGKLGGSADKPAMTNVQVLFKMAPKTAAGFHFGSRIVFDRDGYLFVAFGDRGDSPAEGANHRAQLLNDHAGKTIRLFDDGRVPPDNPFVKTKDAKPEIFTLGNRNIQGAALHPLSNKVWAHEHGPQGGDELNILVSGANYGWPVVTYGANYGSGTKIGEGVEKAGMTPPIVHWTPSIAVSGMAFVGANKSTTAQFVKWKGNLLIGALVGQMLVRVVLDGEKVVAQERLFERQLGRIRDVRQAPDGNIYLLTDAADGELLRLEAVQ
jgi:aldose sugar dehydrogenase